MAIQSQPSRISEPFAGSGTKNVIPATNATPSASQAASWASGFPPECSQPISAGGCPVPRNDMNGVLNQLSQDFSFRQDGGVWAWSALADYDTQRVVRGSDGLLYFSRLQSGPGFVAGAQDPTVDDGTYWTSPHVPTVSADDNSSAAANTAWVNSWWTGIQLPSKAYVDGTNGDDSNDGFSWATAKKTIAAAAAIFSSSRLKLPNSITIIIKEGTYDEALPAIQGTVVYYISSGVNGVVLTKTINIGRGGLIGLGGIITLTGTAYITASRGGVIQLTATTDEYGTTSAINFDNVSARAAFYAYAGGSLITYSGSTLNISFTNCTFSTATVEIEYNSFFSRFGTINMSGSVTGKRYVAAYCSGIHLSSSATFIPGSTAGTVDTTSYYN